MVSDCPNVRCIHVFRRWAAHDQGQIPDQGQDLGHGPEAEGGGVTAAVEVDHPKMASGTYSHLW